MSAAPTSVVDVLREARRLLEPEGAWGQGAHVQRLGGRYCYCLSGALRVAAGDNVIVDDEGPLLDHSGDDWLYYRALDLVHDLAGGYVAPWNDDPERRKDEVLAVLDRAIEAAAEASS